MFLLAENFFSFLVAKYNLLKNNLLKKDFRNPIRKSRKLTATIEFPREGKMIENKRPVLPDILPVKFLEFFPSVANSFLCFYSFSGLQLR